MTTTTPIRIRLPGALKERLAPMKAGGISPWSEADEKLGALADALVRPYELADNEMRQSERDWFDHGVTAAVNAAMQAVEDTLISQLTTLLAEPPVALLEHPGSEQLRADLMVVPRGSDA